LAWPAAVSLGGYAVFSLTDYQLDLPIIALVVAANMGVLARTTICLGPDWRRRSYFVFALLIVSGLGFCFVPWLAARHALHLGRMESAIGWLPQDTSLLVVRGLRRAEESRNQADLQKKADLVVDAIRDLRAAMGSGAHKEIANYNLGWLELERDPAQARKCFAADLAIAPNRSGAWLGLALASLSLNDEVSAIDSLAMEALSQPSFLASGWWTNPSLAGLRARVTTTMLVKLDRIQKTVPVGRWPEPQARYYATILRWLQGSGSVSDVIAAADSAERKAQWRLVLAPSSLTNQQEILRLSEAWQRTAQWVPTAEQLSAQITTGTALTREEFLRVALCPEPARAFTMVRIYSRREGFAVRLRNPYAGSIRECAPQLRSPLADSVVGGLVLPPGWIFDQELRALAEPATLALIQNPH
jgi:tetratricopeptide (TPR) repeat protein